MPLTVEQWENMAQAAAQPGVHYRPGVGERATSAVDFIRSRTILGRPVLEFIADMATGFTVKQAVRAGVVAASASTLGAFGAAVAAGAVSGAVFAGGKEWARQARENWQQPLPPEAVTKQQKLLERLRDLGPNDWGRLGRVTLRGAVVGAVGGVVGAAVADIFNTVSGSTAPFEGPPSSSIHPSPGLPIQETPYEEFHFPPAGETAIPSPHEAVPTTSPEAVVTHEPSAPTTPVEGAAEPSPSPEPGVQGTPSEIGTPVVTPEHVSTVTPQEEMPAPEATATPGPQENITATPVETQVVGHVEPTPVATPPPPPTPPVPPVVPPDTGMPGVDTGIPGADAGIPGAGVHAPPVIPPHGVDTGIPDADAGIPGAGVHAPPVDAITGHIQNLKDTALEAGDNPWKVATQLLKQANPDHAPSNAEILKVTKILCERNNIGVPEWGVSGAVDHHAIPIGYVLKLDPEVKSIITTVVKGGK